MPRRWSSMEWFARLTRRGPKYGTARGVAVFAAGQPPRARRGGASARADGALRGRTVELPEGMSPSPEFAAWAAAQGVPLTGDRAGLGRVDAHLDRWTRTEMGPALGNEVGLYLGQVLARQVPGACWVVWPNGHPVARLASGREVDVVALVHRRLDSGAPLLTTVYDEATHDEAAR